MPCIERDVVVLHIELQRLRGVLDHRLKHFIVAKRNIAQVIAIQDLAERLIGAAEEVHLFSLGQRPIVLDSHMDPGASVAAFMHLVIHQLGMSPN